MTNHEFTLIIEGQGGITEELENRIYDKMDDCTLSCRGGVVFLTFDRESEHLDDAIISAMNDVCSTGNRVLRVDLCDLVSLSDIARRASLSRQRISLYASGQRSTGFPPPACNIHDDHAPLWSWCEVATWLVENQLMPPEVSEEAYVVNIINTHLAMHQRKEQRPELSQRIADSLEDCEACQ